MTARTFGPDDAELLSLFAKHAAIALANARMHEAAEERARAEAAAAERDRLLAEVHDTLARRLVSIQVHLDMPPGASSARRRPGRRASASQHGGQGRPGRGAADAARAGRLTAGRAAAGRRAARRGGLGGEHRRLEVRLVTAGPPVP